ncbi:MAG: alpha/beta fold hydrolase [Planctomycetes bacterium]|nr:alpha/beta fold hydrolase [Planctomycetota bacterium]
MNNARRFGFVPWTVLWASIGVFAARIAGAEEWPRLPDSNGAVEIPAQEWPLQPGARTVRVGIYYPDGSKKSVGPGTGLFLTLHNWGGLDLDGTADPNYLARKFNVVAISVRYLQSGKKASIDDPEPYDFGWLQGLDALRALWLVFHELDQSKVAFARDRIYATGGSGGGNVSLMANKLAPRTFTCIVDICGMKKLSDALAYNLPEAHGLDGRWSRDPASPNFLAIGAQEIRFAGHPSHLAAMKRLGSSSMIFTVNGVDDLTCLDDAREMIANIKKSGLRVSPVWVTPEQVDGTIFRSTGHDLGDRTRIPEKVAGEWLAPDAGADYRRTTLTDFERGDEIRYRTRDGVYIISYAAGYPVGRFEPARATPAYPDRFDLLTVDLDGGEGGGHRRRARTAAEWQTRRRHIQAAMESVMGPFPNPARRVALDLKVIDAEELESVELPEGIERRKVSYRSDATGRVSAYLFLPRTAVGAKRPAVLCLQQTTTEGKREPAGLAGDSSMHYALHLAHRGYVTLAPDYPGYGESTFDFSERHGYASGTMKAIWDNVRAVDLLETLPEVDADRIGVIGHSLGGHNALFTAAFEPRLKVIVSSCGFTTFRKDDMPSWTAEPYMPRIANEFGNDAARVPFDFPEIVAALAPRPFLACAATRDADFDVSGVRDVLQAAAAVYDLMGVPEQLTAHYPEADHSFPEDARRRAYAWLDLYLKQ